MAVLFKKQPDVIINFSDDPLNDVERVYNKWIPLLLHSSPKTIQKYLSISEEQIPETMEIARERQHQLAVKQKEQEIEEARKMALAGYPIPKYIKLFVKRDILAA